jgi:hypothetical protein
VTRSQGWNITERVNGNVDNEIEQGMKIPMIKSRILQVSKRNRASTFTVTTKFLHGNTQGSSRISRSD